MGFTTFLGTLRQTFAHGWMVLVFGAIYLVSQTVIGSLLAHLGPEEIGRLQVTGFTASTYIETFQRREAEGVMPFYRAHFVVDGVHPLWYSLWLLAMLALALERAGRPGRDNWLLVLPPAAGAWRKAAF